jgi:hypothetical protein
MPLQGPESGASLTSAPPGHGGIFISDDSILEGSLEFHGDRIAMWGGGKKLLSWKPGECRLERLSENRFLLSADGETITFTADQPEELEAAIAGYHKRYGGMDEQPASGELSPPGFIERPRPLEPVPEEPRQLFSRRNDNPVAPTPSVIEPAQPPVTRRPYIKSLGTQATEAPAPDPEPAIAAVASPIEAHSDDPSPAGVAIAHARRRTIRAKRFLKSDVADIFTKLGFTGFAAAVLGAIAFAVFVLAGGLRATTPTTAATETTRTTVPVVITTPDQSASTTTITTLPPRPALEGGATELAGVWNAHAVRVDETLLLPTNLTNPFSVSLNSFISLEGVLDPDTGSLVLRATPTGTPQGDRAILASLGLVIAVSDPTLTPENRAQLLQALGLDVRNPQLAGIDGTVRYNGLAYRLVYLADQVVLQLSVQPEAAVTTTTATT